MHQDKSVSRKRKAMDDERKCSQPVFGTLNKKKKKEKKKKKSKFIRLVCSFSLEERTFYFRAGYGSP
jgi:hypothetical protein